MLKRQVIAADISNLTDARYFASWGVDYLMFDLNHIGIKQIQEISEWVNGVQIFIFFDQKNIHLVEEVLLKNKPYAVGTADKFVLDKLLTYVTEGSVFYYFTDSKTSHITLTSPENIDPNNYQIESNKNVQSFTDIESSEAALNAFLSNNNSAGIILRGSSEIETGLKSYENVDALLELLEVKD